MRLKYQLRGLGIGIIITAALLMCFSDEGEVSAKSSAGTQDIVAEADTTETASEEITEQEAAKPAETVEMQEPETETETAVTEPQETSATEETTSEAETENEPEAVSEEASTEAVAEEPVANTEGTVTITIVGGDDSGTVARKLQTAGLVENAREFDAYLMQHGYDKKISVGTVEISKGSGWLEIAEKISGKK